MSNASLKIVYVAAIALRRADGAILLAQRPEGKAMSGLWELPGGKIETGETPEAALVREVEEELAVTVTPEALKPLTFASHGYGDFHLVMPVFLCDHWQGEPVGQENQAIAWVQPDDLENWPAPEADEPLFNFLKAWNAAGAFS